jgi:hypothetical protein
MLDAPVDAWYVWAGLALVAATALGTASQFPTAPPPDAGAAAGTVARVAAVDHESSARHPVAADAVRVEPGRLSLRDDGRTARATLPRRVTPVARGTALWRVLRGARPSDAFEDPEALRRAARAARADALDWRRTDELVVRTVTWGGVRVTLVGA